MSKVSLHSNVDAILDEVYSVLSQESDVNDELESLISSLVSDARFDK